MRKIIFYVLLVSILVLGLSACNQAKNIAAKTDQTLEQSDTQIHKISKDANLLQPAGKAVDQQIETVHKIVHPSKSTQSTKTN